ncbi:MAG: glycoside hydrolase family 130 protein [Phycisphaerae bacterium]
MAGSTGRDLLHRHEANPILTVKDVPYPCNTVFNCTPVKYKGEYLMIVRVEGLQGYSFFALARSEDGVRFTVDDKPCMTPARGGPHELWEENGIEDPRLTEIDGKYYIMYTGCSRHGHYISLAVTEDFEHYERLGVVSGPGNKDGVLFPRKVNGLYARLDRPFGNGVGSVWISYSPDLLHWGKSHRVFTPRSRYWDQFRIGASCPPIQTDLGWLEIYHGVKMTSAGPIYRTGTIMLDMDDPSKVLGRCQAPILSPREEYERIGDVGNVCFASGAIVEPNREVKVYYGAADTSICVATATLDELIESCFLSGDRWFSLPRRRVEVEEKNEDDATVCSS